MGCVQARAMARKLCGHATPCKYSAGTGGVGAATGGTADSVNHGVAGATRLDIVAKRVLCIQAVERGAKQVESRGGRHLAQLHNHARLLQVQVPAGGGKGYWVLGA